MNPARKGISEVQLSHTAKSMSAVFDDPNLVGSAGLVPVMRLAARAGLADLADRLLSVPTDKGAHAGVKVASLVAGMVAGADSIDDLAVLRHGGMAKLFTRIYAPSTLGSFLRAFRFGHVRQLDAVAARFLHELTDLTPVLTTSPGFAFVDVDDTVIGVHGHAKQGAGFGYNQIRGLNALLATVTVAEAAPVIVAQRLRKGSAPQPAARNGWSPTRSRRPAGSCSRAHRFWCGWTQRSTAATRSTPPSPAVRRCRSPPGWTAGSKPRSPPLPRMPGPAIEYTDAVFDDTSGQWISRAEVAEIAFTAFAAQPKRDQVPGRLIVRRIPDSTPDRLRASLHRQSGPGIPTGWPCRSRSRGEAGLRRPRPDRYEP